MKSNQFIIVFILSCFSIVAQQKISVEEIYSGAFRTQSMDALLSMKNSNQYTVLNFDRSARSSQIDLYDFATLKKVATLIDTKSYKELQDIDSYIFNADETKILIANNTNRIYRHSFTEDFFLYNIADVEKILL